MKAILFLVLLALAGCEHSHPPYSNTRQARSDENETDPDVKGITNGEEAKHPTFGEKIFNRLGIK